MKKTLRLGFGRWQKDNSIFITIFSCYVNIKLHIPNQPPRLFNSWDSCEEDLKIWIRKTTSNCLKTILGSPYLTLSMLENKFCWIPAISYFPGVWVGGWLGGWAETKLKLTQFNFKWNCLFELSLAK